MRSVQFGLCSIHIFLLSFFFFFLFLSVFFLTDTNDSEGRERELLFFVFSAPANEHSINSSRFPPVIFAQSVSNYQTES